MNDIDVKPTAVQQALRHADESYERFFKLCCNVFEIVTPQQLQAAHCEYHLRLCQLADTVRRDLAMAVPK
jgi:hypothetical protein